MNKERLLDAARRLRLVPPEKFDITIFTRTAGRPLVSSREDLERCGSAACFLGWLPSWYPEDWSYFNGIPRLRDSSYTAFTCGAMWFDIPYSTMDYIADPTSYQSCYFQPTPSQVADRIEQLVKSVEEAGNEKHYRCV